jgi:hypothetical protein
MFALSVKAHVKAHMETEFSAPRHPANARWRLQSV